MFLQSLRPVLSWGCTNNRGKRYRVLFCFLMLDLIQCPENTTTEALGPLFLCGCPGDPAETLHSGLAVQCAAVCMQGKEWGGLTVAFPHQTHQTLSLQSHPSVILLLNLKDTVFPTGTNPARETSSSWPLGRAPRP